ncbi:glutathione S-transferase family protein [Acidovorax sp.]|uniref:glutathione S-transferase family protein n=1 Tax=Acidovorax sp. TaxID=1872122 RepID=UPI002ACD8009|nr:glutathione S-transferase family protein [Acidovorax sp.]MDZ7865955.1 glutathione S-transferase family protein [Acidovorax sp.]
MPPLQSTAPTAAEPAEPSLRLYHHPVSTTSRPIMMFAADHSLAIEMRVVDLFAGEQFSPAFTTINPNQAVPVLEHGEFRLTESSTILKYLADHVGSATYPAETQSRARVNEAMDWLNTGLSRELLYGLAYPQLFPPYRRRTAEAQQEVLSWAQPRVERLLSILDADMIGPNGRFLVGEHITLADYLGLGILTVGEAVGLDYAPWPNLQRWLRTMKARSAYVSTHAMFHAVLAQPGEATATDMAAG